MRTRDDMREECVMEKPRLDAEINKLTKKKKTNSNEMPIFSLQKMLSLNKFQL